MTLQKEPSGPMGDASRHHPLAVLEDGLRALAAPPVEVGRVMLLVRRHADGSRETPDAAAWSPERGLVGDGWERRPPREPDAQLAIMRHDVAMLIANGQALTLFGDNALVSFDLSAANVPFGAQLRVGEARVVMTPKPHNGCAKFSARFGADALRFVNQAPTRPLNLRGVYWRVIEAGTVRVGDAIRVTSRPAD